jgi:hypothetical protein
MAKWLWQLTEAELLDEIAVTEKMIAATGYNKLMQDHLMALEGQLEERQIESEIFQKSQDH